MQRVNNTRSSHILSLPRILREANDPVRNDHTDSKFSWNKLEVAHPLLPENTGRISHLSRPPLNEYLCLKTELQRSLLTSPKPRVAWEITGYDWPLYHSTSGNIFTMRGNKCYSTPIDLNSTGPQFNRSSVLVSCLMYESEGLGWLSERLGNPDRMFPLQTAGL